MSNNKKDKVVDVEPETKKIKSLVTGGKGFIGAHLVDALISKGHDVCVIDDGSAGEKSTATVNAKAENHDLNLCDFEKVDAFFKENFDIDYVFHLAADSKGTFLNLNPLKTHVVNSVGVANLLQYCHILNIKRVVSASCSSVYGIVNRAPFEEDMSTDNFSALAVSKTSAEALCEFYNRAFGVDVVTLRLFNVYGDNCLEDGDFAPLVSKVLKQKRSGEKYTVHGDGNQVRDFVHVDDVVKAMIMAAESTNKEISGEVLNVGSGTGHSVMDVINMVEGGATKRIHWMPTRANDQSRSLANINKIKKYLDWEPTNDLKDYIDSKK